jgi:hypothetical protein
MLSVVHPPLLLFRGHRARRRLTGPLSDCCDSSRTCVVQFVMFRFEQRPLKPWGARDAGNFFVKFYIIVQVVLALRTSAVVDDPAFCVIRPHPPPPPRLSHVNVVML